MDQKQNQLSFWPSPQDYNEAVQNPKLSFADTGLSSGEAETDGFGLPKPNTGMFASVYHMRCRDGDWALRCFLHCVSDLSERYAAISQALQMAGLPNILHFELQERGVLVKGHWYPVLKMQWCEGVTLDRWVAARLLDRQALMAFCTNWKEALSAFKTAGIAHGDLQHGNVMMTDEKITIVDYDGMYVPALAEKKSSELGHRDYQHPLRNSSHFGPYLDNFSAWVIAGSVEILSHDPGLWHQLKGGEDCLLFRQKDFVEPLNSSTFMLLENHVNPEVRETARTLRYLCTLSPEQVPPLDKRPRVPENLPEMGSMRATLPVWFSDEDQDPENAVDPFLEMGPLGPSLKRRRSRLKGGAPVRTRSQPISPDNPPLPISLSPLAQLARKVRGMDVRENAAGTCEESTASACEENAAGACKENADEKLEQTSLIAAQMHSQESSETASGRSAGGRQGIDSTATKMSLGRPKTRIAILSIAISCIAISVLVCLFLYLAGFR